ncbi:MAG: VCBS repeat-containing protein [Planctomycetes bacterium]|nr:VCBS repeat-containing protein [Planctomycetota bacterium]
MTHLIRHIACKLKLALLVAMFLATAIETRGAPATDATVSFQRIDVTDVFWSEGAHYGDFNHDGKMDICAGPYWYAGPDFKDRHAYTAPPEQPYDGERGYSDYFLSYCYDFDSDGWMDILVFFWPGKETAWFRNPQNRPIPWEKHVIVDVTDGESPGLADMNGDGRPEVLAFTGGQLGFAEINWQDPTAKARYWPISPADSKKYFRYYHGYGSGDINGDSRPDILDKEGWWEQPADYRSGDLWKQHKFSFTTEGGRGGAQMLVYDVNGDSRNDVITSWDAHGYGLVWYEQTREGDEISFKPHVLVNTSESDNPHGVKFTQIHALVPADINSDGLTDFVTGKRFWAHGPMKDAEPGAPAVLYWFELRRNGSSAEFIPHLIDDNSGVGTQITAGDLNGDGRIDVLSSNKKGVHVFLQK